MGCNRCRRDYYDYDRYDEDRYQPYPRRRRRGYYDTSDYRRRRRDRSIIIGFPRIF